MFIAGTMGNYLKSLGLQQKWQKRKDDEHLSGGKKVVTTAATSQKGAVYTAAVEGFMKEQEEFRSKIKSLLKESSECSRASVEAKLQYGGKLSAREMEYIRNNCPDLYAKAAEREKERQEYAAQMRNCNSKDEVFALRMGKIASFMGECRAAEARGDYGASFEIRARLYNVEEEWDDFIKSDEYQELCRKEKAAKEAAEIEAQEKKAAEAEVENANQDEGIKPPDEEEIQNNETTPGQEPELPETDPDTAKDNAKPKPNGGHRASHAEKTPDAHLAEGKIKAAATNYQKNKAVAAPESFDVKSTPPLNSSPAISESGVDELQGNLSINI